MLVDERHPAQTRRGDLAQPGVPRGGLLDARLAVAPRPARQGGLVLAHLCLRHDGQHSGPQLGVADVGIEQHRAEPVVAVPDPVNGVAVRVEPVVEVVFDRRAMAVEERAVHVDGLVECVAPRRVQEAHEREGAARGRHVAYPGGGRDAHAVEQDPLLVAGDPAHVDSQHPGRLDQGQPRQQPLHATDRRVRCTRRDARQRRVRLVVADGDQRSEAVAHRRRQTRRHAGWQPCAGVVSGSPHRAAPHRVARRENVLVAQPGARPRQQRGRALEPERFVFEAPRQPFAAGGIERTQAPGLAAAVLMVGDRLLPTGVGVDRLGGGSQLQGGEPQDLPVNLHGRLLGTSAEHTHDGDLVGDPQLIVAAPPQGDLASVGLEKAGLANQTGARDVGIGDRHGAVRHKRTFWPNS